MIKNKEIWIGLVGVTQKIGITPLGKNREGGYAYFVSWAASHSKFQRNVIRAVKQNNLIFDEMSEVEPLNNRLKRLRPSKEIARLARLAERGKGTFFGTFYCYLKPAMHGKCK